MTASTTTHPQSRKQTIRPSVGRTLASYYVDLLLCGFLAWITGFALEWGPYWIQFALVLWVSEKFICRERLIPTAGEYCVGIRYLTSSSSQVVADIKVVHPKLKLNGFLIAAGVSELTLAIGSFSGWTLLPQAAFFGIRFGPPLSVAHWALAGFAFFLCSGYLLSGSKPALFLAPAVHGLLMADLFAGRAVWQDILQGNDLAAPMMAHFLKNPPLPWMDLFTALSLFVVVTVIFSRKQLVN